MRRDPWDEETHARLLNWGRFSRGGVPEPGEGMAGLVDKIDAMQVEAAVILTRRKRPRYYRFIRRRYLYGWSELALCQEFRCGETKLRRLTTAVLAYVRALLDCDDSGDAAA